MARFYKEILALLIFFGAILFALPQYPGRSEYFFFFSFISVIYIYRSIFNFKFFFEVFFCLFLTLGFFFKLNFKLASRNLTFVEPVGFFSGSGATLDLSLLYISIAFAVIIVVNEILKKLKLLDYSTYRFPTVFNEKGIFRMQILAFAAIAILCGTNSFLKIYQRGLYSTSDLNFLRPLFAWGLVFGFASVMAYFVNKLFLSKYRMHALALGIGEMLLSSISLMSSAFILNASAIFLVLYRQRREFGLTPKKYFLLGSVALVLVVSLIGARIIRTHSFGPRKVLVNEPQRGPISWSEAVSISLSPASYQSLLVDRWVGLEGVLSAVSYTGNRQQAFQKIVSEKISDGQTSYYDNEIARSQYGLNIETGTANKFISLPGLIGWLLLLDNPFILIAGLISIVLLAFSFELANYFLTQNIFLCSLLAQTLAYRFCNFGYLPLDSYKLIGGLILSVVLVAVLNKVFQLTPNKTSSGAL
jgi:hypothetical protein